MTNTNTLTVTSRAAKRIADILKTEPEKIGFRIGVSGGGCSGFQYEFSLASKRGDDDHLIEKDGITVHIDETSLPFLQNAELDFVDDLMGSMFKIKNPNAASSCGCGVSFSI